MAADPVPFFHLNIKGCFSLTALRTVRAAGTEAAAFHPYGRIRHQTFDGMEAALSAAQIRQCAEQPLGIRVVTEAFENLLHAAALHKLACIHHRDFITGLCNKHMDARDNSYGHRKLYNAESFTQSSSDALSGPRLLERMKPAKGSAWIRNHANGFPADALPGDYEILDKATTIGLHVGRDLVQLRGSALAMVDLTDFGSRVRLVGQSVETHTALTEHIVADQFTVDNQAANIQEAFGLLHTDGQVVDYDLDTEKLTPRDEFAVPLYRLQHVSGALAQGFEDIVVGWPVVNGKDAPRHDDTQEPPMLARRRLDYSGEATQASAHSLASVKTPWIQGITQLGYGGRATEAPYMFDDLREP